MIRVALVDDQVLIRRAFSLMLGIEATRRIVPDSDAKVVILTTFDRDDYLFEALAAGAAGFLLKNSEPERLLEAIRTVVTGGALLAPEVTRRVIAQAVGGHRSPTPSPELDRLTERDVHGLLREMETVLRELLARDVPVKPKD